MSTSTPLNHTWRSHTCGQLREGDAGVEVTLDVLKGNKVEPVKVKSIARELHMRSRPVY